MENRRKVSKEEVRKASKVILSDISFTLSMTDMLFPGSRDMMLEELIGQLQAMLPKEQNEACTCPSDASGEAKCECGEAKQEPVQVKSYSALMGTVQLMGSEDYKDRFRAEYYQTKIRYDKLHKMCVKYEAGKLDFTPSCELDLLKRQKAAMGNYLHCLEVRAQIEEVTL